MDEIQKDIMADYINNMIEQAKLPTTVIGSIAPCQIDGDWLECDGRPIPVKEYRELYELMKKVLGKEILIKEVYDVGDEIAYREVFRLPDFRDSRGVSAWIKAK